MSTAITTRPDVLAPAPAPVPPPEHRGGSRPRRAARRLPSLDGLRAVSIALVVLWHVAELHVSPVLSQLWRLDPGNLGVRTFFVISGFLITTLLLDEQRETGSISLARFYFRRTFRIMPAFYVFLAAMAIGGALGLQPLGGDALLHAATYTSNYLRTDWAVGHSWTLSVEEQFYLLWPGLLLLAGLRGGFRLAAGMLLVSPVLRAAAVIVGPQWPDNPRYAFETVADALAMGCLLARHRDALWTSATYRRVLESRIAAWWPAALGAVAMASVQAPLLGAAVGLSVANLVIAFGIDRSLRLPDSPLGRVLNLRAVAWVGTLSYSLYLWQQPFLWDKSSLPIPIRLAAAVGCAVASYYLVEKPALRLRGRVERRLFGR